MKLSDVFEAVRQGQDLSGADLSDPNLRLADLTGAPLSGAVLRGKHRPSVVGGPQSVWQAVVDDTERPIVGQFRAAGADMRQVDLTWANVRKRALPWGGPARSEDRRSRPPRCRSAGGRPSRRRPHRVSAGGCRPRRVRLGRDDPLA